MDKVKEVECTKVNTYDVVEHDVNSVKRFDEGPLNVPFSEGIKEQ